MKSDFALNVDLTNPGQFLACCGILELASRLDPSAMAWFDRQSFQIANFKPNTLEAFIKCEAKPVSSISISTSETVGEPEEEKKEEKSPPILLGAPFDLLLDWWEDDSASEAGFKTWSAGMTVPGFFNGTVTGKGDKQKQSPSMRDHLGRHMSASADLLQSTEAIEKPSPFNFDSRVGRNVPIDLGFGGVGTFAFSPAVEILAIVGLQRFRPSMITRWKRNAYFTWSEPLPVNIAAAVAHGLIPSLSKKSYVFAIKGRDAQNRYKAFGTAFFERNFNV